MSNPNWLDISRHMINPIHRRLSPLRHPKSFKSPHKIRRYYQQNVITTIELTRINVCATRWGSSMVGMSKFLE